MFKLAIFDLDGTLLDTLTDLAVSCNHALSLSGFPPYETDAYKLFVGRGVDILIQSMLPEKNRDEETVSLVKARFLTHYNEHSQDLTEPYSGVLDMLESLKAAGVKTAVLSNKPHVNAVMLCKFYFPDLIDFSAGQRAGYPIKPDPASVFEIMERFASKPAQTVYIGDSGVDMKTGKNAGLHTIGVSWGFRTKDELLSNGADRIVDHASELVKIIL